MSPDQVAQLSSAVAMAVTRAISDTRSANQQRSRVLPIQQAHGSSPTDRYVFILFPANI